MGNRSKSITEEIQAIQEQIQKAEELQQDPIPLLKKQQQLINQRRDLYTMDKNRAQELPLNFKHIGAVIKGITEAYRGISVTPGGNK